MTKVKERIHLSSYVNETSDLCSWHINGTHYLEAWGDARTYDGTLTLAQPLIEPLHGAKSSVDVLKILAGRADASNESLVRESYKLVTGKVFEDDTAWRQALHDGFAADTGVSPLCDPRLEDLPSPN